MRTLLAGGLLACAVAAMTSGPAWAEGWKLPKMPSPSNNNSKQTLLTTSAANTLKRMDAGAKKFVRGTVDVITLRPFWDKKKGLDPPVKPWLNHTTEPAPKKSSGWGSWFAPEEDSRPQTMKDFIGMKRPE